MNKGFTIIELLVIIATLMTMTGFLVIYNRAGERQIIIFQEQAKVINAISRARSLSVATFGKASAPCGYGVHFDAPRTVTIFKDLAADCGSADKKYTPSNPEEKIEQFHLDSKVSLDLGLTDVLFIPPDPIVIITPNPEAAVLNIKEEGGTGMASIKINKSGHIGTEPETVYNPVNEGGKGGKGGYEKEEGGYEKEEGGMMPTPYAQ
ncbi:MAG: type II secretion system protein [Patescibacteria group bacterium]